MVSVSDKDRECVSVCHQTRNALFGEFFEIFQNYFKQLKINIICIEQPFDINIVPDNTLKALK